MSHLKSYVVTIWRRRAAGDPVVLGVVRPLEEERRQTCETVEEFLDLLQSTRRPRFPRERGFSSFVELRDLLESSW